MEPLPAEVTCESELSTGKKSQTEVIKDEPCSAPSLLILVLLNTLIPVKIYTLMEIRSVKFAEFSDV